MVKEERSAEPLNKQKNCVEYGREVVISIGVVGFGFYPHQGQHITSVGMYKGFRCELRLDPNGEQVESEVMLKKNIIGKKKSQPPRENRVFTVRWTSEELLVECVRIFIGFGLDGVVELVEGEPTVFVTLLLEAWICKELGIDLCPNFVHPL